jgi:methylmalonyl-CoA/ethylmalonyl-CoA epimerase
MITGLAQVAQRATNLDRAVAFYTTVLGAPPIGRFDPPGLAFFQLGDVRLLLEANAPSALLYLRVADVRQEYETLRGRGVEFVNPPRLVHTDAEGLFGPAGEEEWMAFFRDSEGNTVGLAARRRPTASR